MTKNNHAAIIRLIAKAESELAHITYALGAGTAHPSFLWRCIELERDLARYRAMEAA